MAQKYFDQYQKGMTSHDLCHPPTLRSQWLALLDEITEFKIEPSIEEGWDVLHAFGLLVWKTTGIPLQWLAYPTVNKHGRRYAETGCIRSRRNCKGDCCR